MTEPTEFEKEHGISEDLALQMKAEGEVCIDIIGRVLANRSLPVCVGALTSVIAVIASEVSCPGRDFIASDIERLALHIRNLPTEQAPESAPVGATVN